ncbi:MAG: signal peptide peptidase SppA [Kofleriaceae bacterium]
MTRWLLAALLCACSSSQSALDNVKPAPAAADPWTQLQGSGSGSGEAKSGFDVSGLLTRLKDSLEKPGPYEAPEHSSDYAADKAHAGVMHLGGALVEREAFSWTGGNGTELRKVIDRLRELATEPQLAALVLRIDAITASVPDIVELRAAMHDFRAAKKQLVCHVEGASNATYLVLAACSKIALAPLGEIAITGPATMPIHLKGLLDKFGVTADFIHIGAYKGAAEPLTRDAPSPEMKEVLGNILDRRYQTMVDIIGTERGVDAKALIDEGMFSAKRAQEAKLVDEVTSFEMARDELKLPWTKLELSSGHRDQLASYLSIARFIGAMPPEKPFGDHVAVVYALGNIVDGGDGGILKARSEIAAHTLVAALHAIAADASVKAVVLRIDSGGGSAQASELIWAAVADLQSKKPVIVSMSDVAASGGYYIASGATKIFALDDTLTGSIGVIGGRVAIGPALAKLGVTSYPIGRGKHATMMSSLEPWSADDKALIEKSMREVYDTFKARVAAGRHKTVDAIEPIAQGHVWTGAKAKELGLVDEIGGLDAALAEARKLGKVDAATDLEIYPPAPTLRDVLHGFGGGGGFGVSLDLAGIELPAAAKQLIELARTFETTHVQTLTWFPEIQ